MNLVKNLLRRTDGLVALCFTVAVTFSVMTFDVCAYQQKLKIFMNRHTGNLWVFTPNLAALIVVWCALVYAATRRLRRDAKDSYMLPISNTLL